MISVFYLKMAPQYEKPASKPKPYNINIEAVGGSSSYGKSQTPSKLSCLSVRRSDLRIMLISHCSKIVQQRDLSTARAKTSNILLIFLNYAQVTNNICKVHSSIPPILAPLCHSRQLMSRKSSLIFCRMTKNRKELCAINFSQWQSCHQERENYGET